MYHTDYIKLLLLRTYYRRKYELQTFSLRREIDVFNSYSIRVHVVIKLPVKNRYLVPDKGRDYFLFATVSRPITGIT
jgi:hypothetical protein